MKEIKIELDVGARKEIVIRVTTEASKIENDLLMGFKALLVWKKEKR